MADPKAELEEALASENETERMLGVVAAVDAVVRDLGVSPVVVGGLAVQYWTHGEYSTDDIDVLLPHNPEIDGRLAALGFHREGRHWVLLEHGVYLEAPGSFLAHNEDAAEVRLRTGRSVLLLSPEDVLIYRLHEFVGTGHREAASQAVSLLRVPELDRQRLAQRIAEEGLDRALEALEGIAERLDRGESIEPHELHEIARKLP